MPITDLLSFQLYSARDFPPVETQLATLAALGYRHVETYDALYSEIDKFVAALGSHGLDAPSGHFSLDLLESDFPRTLSIARKLKTRMAIAPHLAPLDRPSDSAGWRAFGARLAEIAKRLADEGLSFAWHNHDYEMRPLADGRRPIDVILSADERIFWQADVGWIARAGADPVAWLARHGGRIGALHVKDLAPRGADSQEGGWADPGMGMLDLKAIVEAGLAAGAKLLVAEHDAPSDYRRFARNAIVAARGWEERRN